jgi:hypothetical protein
MSELKIDLCFENLQEILNRVNMEAENIVEDPFCLVFYDNKGKLWQLKECAEAGDNRYNVDPPGSAVERKEIKKIEPAKPSSSGSGTQMSNINMDLDNPTD